MFPSLILVYLLAALLQFQHDFIISGTSIRIALSDLLLPLFLAYGVFYSRREKDFFLDWQIPKLKFWVLGFSLILVLGLGIAYFYEGHINGWAIKRLLGWPVLIGYFFLGSLIKSGGIKNQESFVKAFIITYTISFIFLIFIALLDFIFSLGLNIGIYQTIRLKGFVENPNCYALLGVFSLALLTPHLTKFSKNGTTFAKYSKILIPLSITLAASRGAFLACLGFLLVLYHYRKIIDLRKLLNFTACFAVIIALSFSIPYLGSFFSTNLQNSDTNQSFFLGYHEYIAYNKTLEQDDGIVERFRLLQESLSNWRSKPILGIGLGNSLEIQKHNGIAEPIVPHNTALWILSELGLIGFVFVLIFVIKIWRLALNRTREEQDIFALSFLALMVSMGIGSMTTDIFYQRHLWVLLGLFLVKPNHDLKNNTSK